MHRYALEPAGENLGSTSDGRNVILHRAGALTHLHPTQMTEEQFQQQPYSAINQRMNQMQPARNIYQTQPFNEMTLRQPISMAYPGMSDPRHAVSMRMLSPPRVLMPQVPPQMYHPMQQLQRLPNFPAQPYQLQQVQVPQLEVVGGTPQIQLSQRQMELLAARNQLKQQQQQIKKTNIQPNNSGITLNEQNKKEPPVFLTKSNLSMDSAGSLKQDPPDKRNHSALKSRDPPSAASIVMSYVEENSVVNESKLIVPFVDTNKEAQEKKTLTPKSDSSNNSNSSEQQRKFLRSILQKVGTQSIASSTSSSNKVNKALVKKVLQKGASHLSGGKSKYAVNKSSNANHKKFDKVHNNELRTTGSNNSLRERWFSKKSASLIDSATMSTSMSSTSSLSTKGMNEFKDKNKVQLDTDTSIVSSDAKPSILATKSATQNFSIKSKPSSDEQEIFKKAILKSSSEHNGDGEHNKSNQPSQKMVQLEDNRGEISDACGLKMNFSAGSSRSLSPSLQSSSSSSGPSVLYDVRQFQSDSGDDQYKEYYIFLESLRQEVFSGQFTQLWSSFSSLILHEVYEEAGMVTDPGNAKPFKVDPYTKQKLKEINHHAKKFSRVECMPRSQLINDKKYFQEFPDRKQEANVKRKAKRDYDDPILTMRSATSSVFDEEAISTTGSVDLMADLHSSSSSETNNSLLRSRFRLDPSMEKHRNINPMKDCLSPTNDESVSIQRKPSLHINTSYAPSHVSDGMTEASEIRRHSSESAELTPKTDKEIEMKERIPSKPIQLSCTSNSSSASAPLQDKNEGLRAVDRPRESRHSNGQGHKPLIRLGNSEKQQAPTPEWLNITLRSDNTPKNQTVQINPNPAWARVTLRHVDTRTLDKDNANVSADASENIGHTMALTSAVSSETGETNECLPQNATDKSKENSGHSKTSESVASSGTKCKQAENEKEYQSNRNNAVIIRLADVRTGSITSKRVEESRVIVGRSILMKVRSLPGQSKATVEWKLPRAEVESMTLDMSKRVVGLLLHRPIGRSVESHVLHFDSEEDCLKFANAYYEMPENNEDIKTEEVPSSSLTFLEHKTTDGAGKNAQNLSSIQETADSFVRLESLNDEEQNVLKTYRLLRQTRAADEALHESISKTKQDLRPNETIQESLNYIGLETTLEQASIAPLPYVMPPDLPSSPISTFSNSVCTIETAEDEKIAEKYRKMLRLRIPAAAVRHKMEADNVNQKVMSIVLSHQAGSTDPGDEVHFSVEDEQIIAGYKKMLKLGLPEDAVRHKMKQDQLNNDKIFAAVFGLDPQNEVTTKLTTDEEAIAAKYRQLIKVGLPAEAVRHKMKKESVHEKIIVLVLGRETTDEDKDEKEPVAISKYASKKKLSDEEESIATHYRKMLKLQIPKDAVLSRMEKEGVSQNIIAAVIGDPSLIAKSKQSNSKQQTVSSSGTSSASNLINFHWNVLSGTAIPGSVWDKVSIVDVKNSDVSELIELFQKKSSKNAGQRLDKQSDDSSCSSNAKVKLLDLTRSNNISISLKAFKEFTYSELADIIGFVDPQRRIRGERAQFVRDLLPTAPEIKLVEAYNGSEDRLAAAELWFRKLIGIPRIETKAQVIRTMEMFTAEAEAVRANFHLLLQVCRQVMDSERLQILLQAVLIIGNKLNEGTKNGAAAGFRFDSLLRLTQTKASDGKTTALDYLVKEFAEKGQRNTLMLMNDFPGCQTASRMLISDITNEVDMLQSALDQCKEELVAMRKEIGLKDPSFQAKAGSGDILAAIDAKGETNADNLNHSLNALRHISSSDAAKNSPEQTNAKLYSKQAINEPWPSSPRNSLSGGAVRLSMFIKSVEEPFSRLKEERDLALQACKDLAKYSGESGGIGATTTILGILAEFASNIETALKKYDDQQRTAARKQKAQESKEIRSALKKIESCKQTNIGNGRSLVLLVNDVLKNANPEFKEDFRKGRIVQNPSDTLKAIYEREQQLKISNLEDQIRGESEPIANNNGDEQTIQVTKISLEDNVKKANTEEKALILAKQNLLLNDTEKSEVEPETTKKSTAHESSHNNILSELKIFDDTCTDSEIRKCNGIRSALESSTSMHNVVCDSISLKFHDDSSIESKSCKEISKLMGQSLVEEGCLISEADENTSKYHLSAGSQEDGNVQQTESSIFSSDGCEKQNLLSAAASTLQPNSISSPNRQQNEERVNIRLSEIEKTDTALKNLSEGKCSESSAMTSNFVVAKFTEVAKSHYLENPSIGTLIDPNDEDSLKHNIVKKDQIHVFPRKADTCENEITYTSIGTLIDPNDADSLKHDIVHEDQILVIPRKSDTHANEITHTTEGETLGEPNCMISQASTESTSMIKQIDTFLEPYVDTTENADMVIRELNTSSGNERNEGNECEQKDERDKEPMFDLTLSEQRILTHRHSSTFGTKRSVSDVVKSLQRYANTKNKEKDDLISSGHRNSLPAVTGSKKIKDFSHGYGAQVKQTGDYEMTLRAHSIQSSTNDPDQKKESQVSRMARQKREEKRSSPLPPKRIMQTPTKNKIDITNPIVIPHDSGNAPASISTSESAMARLARQKRMNKRMTR